ncbi:chemokine XC receptor 1 [Bombina bombina]|uniref:chemokine XC receptor 1 n=1 Tax=Bombina bombina TaxID=8345 RepID=UPI00235AF01D|nr:chemokine XC receptor 1 [Bombina bombina]
MEQTTDFADYVSYSYDESLFNKPCDKVDIYVFAANLTTILNSLFFVFSIIGNCLVLWILIKYENLVSLTNVFIFNLSIADLIFTSWLPFFIVYHRRGWVFGSVACKIFNALFSIGFYSGIIFLTCMTFHRYLSVVDPVSAMKTRKPIFGIMASLISWIISIVASLPVIIFKTQTNSDGFQSCEYNDLIPKLVSNYQQNVSFLVAFAVIIFCYYKIIKTLLRSRSQRNHKPVKLILIIVVVYFISWAPYNVVLLLQSLHLQQFFMDCELIKSIDYAKYISEKLAISHCCLNPILYAFVGIKFRRHLKHFLHHYRPCNNQDELANSVRIHSNDFYHEDGSLY